MTDAEPVNPDPAATAAGSLLVREVAPPIEMVALLGPRDELLRTMERQFPLVDTHVRGNEMSFTGPAGELEIIDGLEQFERVRGDAEHEVALERRHRFEPVAQVWLN